MTNTRPHLIPARLMAASLAVLALPACTSSFTGPVEVTRFVAENPAGLGEGPIVVYFPDEMSNQAARSAFETAVESELRALGYSIVAQEGRDIQVATVRTSRNPFESITDGSRSPVNVGVGGSTGSYGSGVGVGVGINLGGQRSPAVVSELSVRITAASGETLWEGRSELATSIDSPYSEVQASARALAAGLFSDFPGGNGETVSLTVEELERTP